MSSKKETLISLVSNEISNLIISEQYKPGDQLPNEFELAKSLNVSRNTVREAVKVLIAQNVLEIKRGRGTFVNQTPGVSHDPLGFKYINDKHKLAIDCIELRLILEPEIAKLSAQRASQNDLEKIKYWMERVEEKIHNNEDHSEADINFHTAVAKSTKNTATSNIIPVLTQAIPLFIEITNSQLINRTIIDHKLIYEAIKNGDGQLAYEYMRNHIKINEEHILSLKK